MQTQASADKFNWQILEQRNLPFHRIPNDFSWANVKNVRDLTPLFAMDFLSHEKQSIECKQVYAIVATGFAVAFFVYGLLFLLSLYPASQNIMAFRLGVSSLALGGVSTVAALVLAGLYWRHQNADLSDDKEKSRYKTQFINEFLQIEHEIDSLNSGIQDFKKAFSELGKELVDQGVVNWDNKN